jgi:hypothetical protein
VGSIRLKNSIMGTSKVDKKKRGKGNDDDEDSIPLNRLSAEEDYQFKSPDLTRSKNDYPILLRVFRVLQFMSKSNNNIFKVCRNFFEISYCIELL